MIANGSSLVSLITDKDYDRKIAGYLNDDCRRRLYAILKANLLFMFKSAESLEIPLLLIIMEDCVVELADDNSTGMEHSFVIRFNTTGQTYVMATENQEQLKNWISLLTSCSIEFMRATKESLELEHDNRDDEQKEQEKKKHES